MPRRDDLKKILLIGSGPIVIGQAAEFDYSGAQACKVLLEEGYEVILVNSNPATIMTDPEFATRTYVEPLVPASVRAIIEKERPDAMLPTLGGQTALNLAMDLTDDGTLEEFGVDIDPFRHLDVGAMPPGAPGVIPGFDGERPRPDIAAGQVRRPPILPIGKCCHAVPLMLSSAWIFDDDVDLKPVVSLAKYRGGDGDDLIDDGLGGPPARLDGRGDIEDREPTVEDLGHQGRRALRVRRLSLSACRHGGSLVLGDGQRCYNGCSNDRQHRGVIRVRGVPW